MQGYIHTHTHTYTHILLRPLITVSCQAVIEINCSLVQGLVREGRCEVGEEEEVAGGASVSCAGGREIRKAWMLKERRSTGPHEYS